MPDTQNTFGDSSRPLSSLLWKGDYNKALEKSGFSEKIKYHKQVPVQRVRKRKVIWFDPPYSSSVKTNVGKTFMNLIVKHLPKHHRYYEIFNKNSIKAVCKIWEM